MAGSFDVEWDDAELTRLLRAAINTVGDAVVQVLTDTALAAFADSQTQVPVRFGYLKGSGHIIGPEVTGSGAKIEIAYGGPAAPYALFVHEGTARHAPPTKRKYLEDPVLEAVRGLDAKIDSAVTAVLRGGI